MQYVMYEREDGKIVCSKTDVTFVNLTPHDIVVYRDDDRTETIPASGQVARVQTIQEQVDELNFIPVVRTKFGEVEGLPEPRRDTVYIVSSLVLQALRGSRKDIVAPDTGPESAVRDENGRIIGIRRFQII